MKAKPAHPNAKLLKVWQSLDGTTKEVFSTLVGKSKGSLRHVVEGRRGISSDLAIRIEKASAILDLKPVLNRMDLNPTCHKCEYAKACRGKGK